MKEFEDFNENLAALERVETRNLDSDSSVRGVIDRFHKMLELGGSVLRKLLQCEGLANVETYSPSEVIKAVNETYGFLDETLWLSMLRDRDDARVSDPEAARTLAERILRDYIHEFSTMRSAVEAVYEEIWEACSILPKEILEDFDPDILLPAENMRRFLKMTPEEIAAFNEADFR